MSRHASAQTGRGFNVHDRAGCGGWLPAGRQQRAEVVVGGHCWQAFEDVGEVGLRVVTVALGAFHQPQAPVVLRERRLPQRSKAVRQALAVIRGCTTTTMSASTRL